MTDRNRGGARAAREGSPAAEAMTGVSSELLQQEQVEASGWNWSDSKDEQGIGDEENGTGRTGGGGESWMSRLRRGFERVIARATLEYDRVPCAASGQSRARAREKALRGVEGKESRCVRPDRWVVATETAVEDYWRLGGMENAAMNGML